MATSDKRSPEPNANPSPDAGKTAAGATKPIVADLPVVEVAGELVPDFGRMVKRPMAAEMVGLPVSTFRRNVQGIEVKAFFIEGTYYFRKTDIELLALRYGRERQQESESTPPDDPGKLTALVFQLLDDGVTPIDIVKRLEKPAPMIEELHAQWTRMHGTVVLSGDQVERLRSLDWTSKDRTQLTSGDRVVRFIETLHDVHEMDAVSCLKCRAARARVCEKCYALEVERVRGNTRRYVEELKTERAHRAAMEKPLRIEHSYRPPDGGEDSGAKRRR